MPEWGKRKIGHHNSKTQAAITLLSACTRLTGSRSQYPQVLINVFKCLPHKIWKGFPENAFYFIQYIIDSPCSSVLQTQTPEIISSHQIFLSNFLYVFYVHVTGLRNKVLFNKTNRRTNFQNLFLSRKYTCLGQFLCPSSGVLHCTFGLKAVIKPAWHIPVPNVHWKTPDDGQRNCLKRV